MIDPIDSYSKNKVVLPKCTKPPKTLRRHTPSASKTLKTAGRSLRRTWSWRSASGKRRGPYDRYKWSYNPYKWPKIYGFAWGYNRTYRAYNPIYRAHLVVVVLLFQLLFVIGFLLRCYIDVEKYLYIHNMCTVYMYVVLVNVYTSSIDNILKM